MFVFYFILSYLIGSLMAGYVVVRVLGNKDIRTEGSGNVGARNAGRVHGKASFLLTFIGDAWKGAFVVWLGFYLEFPSEIVLIGLGMAIFGHLKPITLKFKGGMGISTFIGGIIAFEPTYSLVLIICFLVLFPFLRSLTIAGLTAFIALPFYAFYSIRDLKISLLILTLVLIILLVHKEDIKDRIIFKNK